MHFTPDPQIDAVRLKYKQEYDDNHAKIRKADSSQLTFLRKKEKFLQNRTHAFLKQHHIYFTNKRNHIFNYLESRGMFGTKPDFEKDPEPIDRRRTNKIPKRVKQVRVCEECGDKYFWYEHMPSPLCRVCRYIKPEGIS